MGESKEKKDHFIIVGIGASAGGLAVLKKFVKSLPQQTGMAYIIIQHLDPTHKSMLAELLSKESKMKVKDAEDNEKVAPDHIYVIPPDTYLELQEGSIKVTKPESTRGTRKAIDHFFRSLAKDRGDCCAGIIFSGSGSDGTAGLREIKATGGLALAQDPDTAEHGSMPLSAIEANAVDKVCRVEEMTDILSGFAEHPMTHKNHVVKEDNEVENADHSLEGIAAILKSQEKFNVNQYKPTTIRRRISRRMSLTNTEHYKDYLQMLRDDEAERKQLTKDLLINVTDFFRDKEAFEVLEKNVLSDIIENLGKNQEIRVWVAGCASGEEAYSIAILLLELLEKAGKNNKIKIFATDIDESAINTARKGIYPESIAMEVPENYLNRYFVQLENGYQYKIKGQVRDLVSFAVQNLASDPPFNHMHLISCRNLLIYINRNVQEKILSSFYFALNQHAYLFLGSSETLGNKAKLFKTASKKWRIYQKIPGSNERKVLLDHLHINKDERMENMSGNKRKRPDTSSRSERMRRSILENATPPTILIDDEGKVLYSHGELDPFVIFPKGEPRYELAQVVKPSIRTRIRSALYKVKKSKEKLTFQCSIKEPEFNELKINAQVEITPIEEVDYADGPVYTVVFTKTEHLSNGYKEGLTRVDENVANADLEQELSETREELQNTIEELETSTEELKASHEEALSTNEELQSSNEELEASSEELRSLNEELTTVNAQLKDKIDELKRANDDAENFFSSTDLPTIFLDPDLKIQRYTPAAEQLLKMGPRDIDREIYTLGRDLVDNDLTEDCKEVLRTFQPRRKEVIDYKNRCFIRQLTPYRTEDRRIEGVVVVFQDVTELKELNKRAEARELQQSVVARIGMLALSGTEPEDLIHQAVRQVAHTMKVDYCKVLKYQPEQNNLIMVAGIGWQEGLVGKVCVSNDQHSQAGYTILSPEPVIVENLNKEKRFSGPDLLTDHHVTSGISCIINHSDPPFGVLSIHTKEERKFSQDDANFLVSVANMLSTAIRTREAQELINDSEENFRTMANSIPQMAWMTDDTGYIFWYNQRWFDYTGTNLEEMQGWGWQKVHHPDHVDRVVNLFKQSLETGEEWEDLFPLRSKYGEYRWFLSRAKPIRNNNGQIVHWFGTNTDITEKLDHEKALKRSEERLRMAKDSARLGVFEWDIVNNKIEWDPLMSEIWGINPDKPISLETSFEGLMPQDREKVQQAIDKSMNPNGDGHYEVIQRVVNQQSNKIFWLKANGKVIFENNQPVRMIGLVNDITEAEQASQELKQSEERLRIAKDAAEIGIAEFDISSGTIHVDKTVRTIYGVTDELPFHIQDFEKNLHPEDRKPTMELFGQVVAPEGQHPRYRKEFRVYNQQLKTYLWVEAFGTAIIEQGKPVKLINSLIDITKRKEAELELSRAVQELRENDKMKNEFLSILGHELRNPLASVNASIDFLGQRLSQEDKLLKIIKNGISTMARLLDDLLDLNRISQNRIALNKETVDINNLLENVVQSNENLFKKKDHQVNLKTDDQLLVSGDQIRLEQILVNLLTNASKYTPNGGLIELKAVKKLGNIQIEVRDNGIGISDELLDKIFDPFYQVKQEGKAMQGLGIGLALVKKLVELHGGSIEAHSEGKNKGSAFKVRLPSLGQTKMNFTGPNHTNKTQVKTGIKILLIEDNEDILTTMPMQLATFGCRVETASNGKDGLAKVESFEPDAMLVDIGLPDMTGHEIAKKTRDNGYNGLMVAISGYSHKTMREKSKAVGFDFHLAKPAKIEDLAKVLSTIS